jgi:hypothetical protein
LEKGCETPINTPLNCGGCGVNCLNSTTSSGLCVDNGFGNYECEQCDGNIFGANCNLDPSDGCEVNLFNDPNNCQFCGTVCPNNQLCTGNQCDCPVSQSKCNETCFNLQIDDQNCGSCGNICAQGVPCIFGVCQACPFPEQTFCPGLGCRNLQEDSSDCGTCGTHCGPPNFTCIAGVCQ